MQIEIQWQRHYTDEVEETIEVPDGSTPKQIQETVAAHFKEDKMPTLPI